MSHLKWDGLTVSVKDRATREPRRILKDVTGCLKAGQLMAIIGPSGSGKTTLLNVLARRAAAASATVEGIVQLDNAPLSNDAIRRWTTYVEQEDTLIGILTVRETISYAEKLARVLGTAKPKGRADELIREFGLAEQADTKIGTPFAKGISGGQKRRASIASQLITQPRILFLDEPTSGLDSAASFEVMSRIRKVAQAENMIVVASIHQPSTSTYNLFDQISLLSRGQTVYSGDRHGMLPYFDSAGFTAPLHMNPAEFVLDLVNTDFQREEEDVDDSIARLRLLHSQWASSEKAAELKREALSDIETTSALVDDGSIDTSDLSFGRRLAVIPGQTMILMQRSLVKAYRDVLTYYVRLVMYFGLAVLMGTVWLRLDTNQTNIQPFMNALFYSGAFMSFMAVAYIPAYLEDFFTFQKEQANGLYGPTPYLITNFLVGLPFLFIICAVFSIFTFFMCNFRLSGTSFGLYLTWLFLDLVAAESLVVLISSVVPIFVAALALTAFANGLWMCVNGFMVSTNVLNVFWYYTFYWIDYQRYVYQGMMFNEFEQRTYACDANRHCMYSSDLESECKIAGSAVLEAVGYGNNNTGQWMGILIALIAAMRLLTWAWLIYRRR